MNPTIPTTPNRLAEVPLMRPHRSLRRTRPAPHRDRRARQQAPRHRPPDPRPAGLGRPAREAGVTREGARDARWHTEPPGMFTDRYGPYTAAKMLAEGGQDA